MTENTLSLNALSTAYGKTVISKHVSAHFRSGELIGLVGPNGSGKSCLLKTVAGVLSPAGGDMVFNGTSLNAVPARTRAQHVAYLAQGAEVTWPLPVRDIIALGRAPYRGPLGRMSDTGQAAIDEAIKSTNCEGFLGTSYDALSGGEQARVNLARALAVDADVLLADEPTNHLDPYYQLTLMEILRKQAKAGKIVIAAVHDLALAQRVCDRLLVMKNGEIKADGTPEVALSTAMLADVFQIKLAPDGFRVV